MYDRIFFTNVLRIMEERGIQKNELHELSGVSASFLSDLTNGKGNPSLKIMEQISRALSVPLPLMLEHVDSEIYELLDQYHQETENLPAGYERVGAILPKHKAYQVRTWDKEARKAIKEKRHNKK